MPIKVGLKKIEIWNDSMEDAVRAYEAEGEQEKGQIVFYGPSYFTRWSKAFGHRPLREDIVGASGKACVVNRGFGSSCPEHQLYYYDRMVRPLAPSVLVYAFDANGAAFGYSYEESWELSQRVIAWAECDFPGIHIYLLGTYPPRDARNACEEENARRFDATIRAFCEERDTRHFLDPKPAFENAPRDVFADHVHFNQKGYDIYRDFFRAALRDELARF